MVGQEHDGKGWEGEPTIAGPEVAAGTGRSHYTPQGGREGGGWMPCT
jgi:hypothetical protein